MIPPVVEQNHRLEEDSDCLLAGRYQCPVGRLIILSHNHTNITFSVSMVSQFMQAPRVYYMNIVYHIIWNALLLEDYSSLIMVTWSIGMPNFWHLTNQTPNSKSQIFSDMLQCHSINRIALYHVGKFFIVFLFTQWALSLSNFFLHTLSLPSLFLNFFASVFALSSLLSSLWSPSLPPSPTKPRPEAITVAWSPSQPLFEAAL